MLIFGILVTISELALALALSGDPRDVVHKAIAASVALGAVDFLLVFGIRNKSEKKQLRTGDSILSFLFGFHSRPLLPSRLRNFTQPEPQRNCQYYSPEMTIVRPRAW